MSEKNYKWVNFQALKRQDGNSHAEQVIQQPLQR